MHRYRNFIPISREEFKKVLHSFKKSEWVKEKLGNRYGSKIKVFLVDENGNKKDMFLYLYGETVDPKAVNRKLKSIEYYLNPKYSYLLKEEITIIAIDQSLFVQKEN